MASCSCRLWRIRAKSSKSCDRIMFITSGAVFAADAISISPQAKSDAVENERTTRTSGEVMRNAGQNEP